MANLIFISGTIGQDAKMTQAGATTITTLSVATTENVKGKDGKWVAQTDWHTVKTFGKVAEAISKFVKGDQVEVTGKLKYGQYKNREGQTIKTTEIVADRVLRVKKAEQKQAQHHYHNDTQNLSPMDLEPQDGDMPF